MDAIKVLVVDDDEGGREAVLRAVQSMGYIARAADDGAEAWAQYREEPADIVLTDWSMPRMDGLELCLTLKAEAVPRPHVILMTAFDERARFLEGMRAGADDFIRKPIDIDELEVRLLAASRLVNTQRALADRNAALERKSEQSFRAARTDPLTGIANRLRLDEDLANIAANAVRYRRRYSAAMCDVDFFKQYNDRFGHLEGDTALQHIAVAIRDAVRSGDMVYRYGGEEFVVILPEQGAAEAARAMERVRAAVEGLGLPRAPISPEKSLTISIGVAELTGVETDPWLARADAALYKAKRSGRNRVTVGEDR